jgi:hypothetical protein
MHRQSRPCSLTKLQCDTVMCIVPTKFPMLLPAFLCCHVQQAVVPEPAVDLPLPGTAMCIA